MKKNLSRKPIPANVKLSSEIAAIKAGVKAEINTGDRNRLSGTALFSFFTADIIKKNVPFTR